MDRKQCDLLLASLASYAEVASDLQRVQANRIAAFVQSCEAPWRRSTLEGHLTASAWIVDESCSHALLVYHKKLDRWLQPGGHIDDSDLTFLNAALREAHEETGLTNLSLSFDEEKLSLFDVDIHPIPARPTEPAHFHYDLRFCFVAQSEAQIALNAEESSALKWFALDTISKDKSLDTSVARMAAISLASRNT